MPRLPAALKTARLDLRRYRLADAHWYAEMAVRNRPHLARYEHGNVTMGIESEADARKVIAEFADMAAAQKACFLGAFLSGTDRFVAQIYVGVGDAALPGYVIGYFCDNAHLRNGYTAEAAAAVVADLFDTCGAERVGLGCDDTNTASQHIAEGLGMRLEGHLRADKRNADGSVSGSLLYGVLRDEYDTRRT